MRKARLITAAILLAGMATGAAATTPWDIWADGLRSNVKTKESAIEVIRKDFRDGLCSDPRQKEKLVRVACAAAFDLTVARRAADMAAQQLLLTTVQLEPNMRKAIIEAVSTSTITEEDSHTTKMGSAFIAIFTLPKRTTQR